MAVRIYGNREIRTLPGEATRPTSARVREALFNIWQGRIIGCWWLDLCAGSGAMGAEALCRGAAAAVGVEKSRAACQIVTQNWQKLARPNQLYQVINHDVVRWVTQQDANDGFVEKHLFDCIYFDPPYAGGLYDSVLSQLAAYLSDRGEVAVEYSEAYWRPDQLPESLEIVKEKRYGSTQLVFLRRSQR